MLQDHDMDIIEMKGKVENMWKNCSSKRERKTMACRDAPGVSLYGDNIGKEACKSHALISHFIGWSVSQSVNSKASNSVQGPKGG